MPHLNHLKAGIGSIEGHVDAVLSELETVLGHGFTSPGLLVRALTHRSLAKERAASEQGPGGLETAAETGDNERLEFLGDAVLGLVVAEALFEAHPEWQEGELTRVRSQLVNRKHVAEVAVAIGLGNHLRLSRGEDRGGLRQKSTVLSNSMEAVMGALFLDGGLEPVRVFARRWVMASCAPEPRWATTNRRCRSTCRRPRRGRRFTGSRAKAGLTTGSVFWWRSA